METNKYIKLDKNDQNMVSIMVNHSIRRLTEIGEPVSIMGDTETGNQLIIKEDKLIDLLKEKQAIILELTREREAYKRQVK